MKYRLSLDENDYLVGFVFDEKGVEFNPTSINITYMNCYKFVDNKVVLDQDKLNTVISEENNQKELIELKEFLINSSDTSNDFVEKLLSLDNPLTFVSDFISLIKSYRETYKAILNQRKQVRQRIKELESLTSET